MEEQVLDLGRGVRGREAAAGVRRAEGRHGGARRGGTGAWLNAQGSLWPFAASPAPGDSRKGPQRRAAAQAAAEGGAAGERRRRGAGRGGRRCRAAQRRRRSDALAGHVGGPARERGGGGAGGGGGGRGDGARGLVCALAAGGARGAPAGPGHATPEASAPARTARPRPSLLAGRVSAPRARAPRAPRRAGRRRRRQRRRRAPPRPRRAWRRGRGGGAAGEARRGRRGGRV
jgi:hypothetical protein